jgi:hypothetical protein
MNLPGEYRDPEYTVGLFLTKSKNRWLVSLRLPDGGFVTIAKYRTLFFADRLVNRSWNIAS